MAKITNPIIPSDYPDVDVIRVEDTYYMVSTTMHFMPGAVILRSYDLGHWETISHIYTELTDAPAYHLDDGKETQGHQHSLGRAFRQGAVVQGGSNGLGHGG